MMEKSLPYIPSISTSLPTSSLLHPCALGLFLAEGGGLAREWSRVRQLRRVAMVGRGSSRLMLAGSVLAQESHSQTPPTLRCQRGPGELGRGGCEFVLEIETWVHIKEQLINKQQYQCNYAFIQLPTYLILVLFIQPNICAMIIIQQQEEEEEGEHFAPPATHTPARHGFLAKIGSISLSKQKIIVVLVLLLAAAVITLAYLNHGLTKALESYRETTDQILLLQTSILNYQPSQYPIPPSKSLTQDAVLAADVHKFQRLLAYYLTPFTNTDCKLRRYGEDMDGGYLLCQNFISHSQVLLNFGIEYSDTFGCDLIDQNQHISNYQFDCTRKLLNKCSRSNETRFDDICLGDKDVTINKWRYSKLQSIIDKLKLGDSQMIVKLDVQGSEWASLAHIPLEVMDRIDQLVVQFHLSKDEKNVSWHYLGLLKSLSSKFAPVNTHMNNFGCHGLLQPLHYLQSDSFEVTFVNRKIIHLQTYDRSFKSSKLNLPNDPSRTDCQQS